jgi:hypothetical protein
MLHQFEIPVAYSMVALAQKTSQVDPQPFQEILCYWSAFNNIYTTIAEHKGYFGRLRTQKNGTIRARADGSVLIPEVEMSLRERDEIDLAYNEFNEALKHKLIAHPNSKFFVERVPKWHGAEVKFDGNGQRLNGVLNVRYTIDLKHPVWSPIDFSAYARYTQDKASSDDINLLAKQLVYLVYTVRNNTFHGGKRADDANDLQVIEKALPILRMIVESFMSRTD